MNYKVQDGDTMYGIAKRYGISFADLVGLNPQITDPDQIYPGQVLQVPGSEKKESENKVGENKVSGKADPAKVLEVAAKLGELVKELGDLPRLADKKTNSAKPADFSRQRAKPRAQMRVMPGFAPAMTNGSYPGMQEQLLLPDANIRGQSKNQRIMEIRLLQQGLKDFGYYNGPISGRIGPRTKAALKKLQKDFGRPVTGIVDRAVWEIFGRR